MIIDLLDYVNTHYTKICKKLKYGPVPDIMVGRLEKRLRHCRLIIDHYALLNPDSYTFNLSNRAQKFGDPLGDFLNYWHHNKHSSMKPKGYVCQ